MPFITKHVVYPTELRDITDAWERIDPKSISLPTLDLREGRTALGKVNHVTALNLGLPITCGPTCTITMLVVRYALNTSTGYTEQLYAPHIILKNLDDMIRVALLIRLAHAHKGQAFFGKSARETRHLTSPDIPGQDDLFHGAFVNFARFLQTDRTAPLNLGLHRINVNQHVQVCNTTHSQVRMNILDLASNGYHPSHDNTNGILNFYCWKDPDKCIADTKDLICRTLFAYAASFINCPTPEPNSSFTLIPGLVYDSNTDHNMTRANTTQPVTVQCSHDPHISKVLVERGPERGIRGWLPGVYNGAYFHMTKDSRAWRTRITTGNSATNNTGPCEPPMIQEHLPGIALYQKDGKTKTVQYLAARGGAYTQEIPSPILDILNRHELIGRQFSAPRTKINKNQDLFNRGLPPSLAIKLAHSTYNSAVRRLMYALLDPALKAQYATALTV